eukprot:GEMP01070622.1.p2 GENE.GEMP01070622.1~~GEMP01070622.1.p2  ORF type:complete len:103 (+),score=22.98 GEMP01070622.1:150-458(+)
MRATLRFLVMTVLVSVCGGNMEHSPVQPLDNHSTAGHRMLQGNTAAPFEAQRSRFNKFTIYGTVCGSALLGIAVFLGIVFFAKPDGERFGLPPPEKKKERRR